MWTVHYDPPPIRLHGSQTLRQERALLAGGGADAGAKLAGGEEMKNMRVIFPKDNKFAYGQYFYYWSSNPDGIEFEVEVEGRDGCYVVRGKGYGVMNGKDYGNGALYFRRSLRRWGVLR